jgi:hypothetical protein
MRIRYLSVCIGISSCMLSFMAPLQSHAAFYLYLKNGGRILTSQYRYENKQIIFAYDGGQVAIAREAVQRIEAANSEDSGKSSLIKALPAKSDQDIKISETKTPTPPPKTEEKQAQVKSKNDPYVMEFAELKVRFGEIQRMTRKDLYQFSEDLVSFRNKVLKNRVGHIYNEEIYQIVTMGDAVEELIKAKGY